MDKSEFKNFFQVVFDKLIPPDAREEISQYWSAFRVEPTFELDDRCIDAIFGRHTKVAAVQGALCYHHFAFRSFVVAHAPEPIARTIIQHEIIHCYLDRKSTPAKVLNQRILKVDSPSTFSQIGRLEAKMRQIEVYSAEETVVTLINKNWSGNDEEAWQWCSQYITDKDEA